MSLSSIKEIAEREFEPFLKNLHQEHPDLVLKYQITKDMKNEFVEGALRQVWNNEPYDRKSILDFMIERHKNLSRKR